MFTVSIKRNGQNEIKEIISPKSRISQFARGWEHGKQENTNYTDYIELHEFLFVSEESVKFAKIRVIRVL